MSVKIVTRAEVNQHNTEKDLWVIIQGKVYDVTSYVRSHPGGLLPLLALAGKDATAPFLGFHPDWVAEKRIAHYHVADLSPDDKYGVNASTDTTPEEKAACAAEFREIVKKMKEEGLYETKYSYYYWMCLRNLTLFALAIYFALSSDQLSYHVLSAVLLGAFWQQSALLYAGVAAAVSGILHIQITLSHFGMPTYDGKPQTGEDDGYSFIKTQLLHSMDVDCSTFMDWFHGGLQFQVMHHLCPRLPRQNLRVATHKYLLPFCQKWKLPYHSFTFWEANLFVLGKLKGVAMSARAHK